MRKFAWLVGGVTLVASGAYTFVSLARWEWSRALFFGLVFVATEVALASGLLLRKWGKLEDRLPEPAGIGEPDTRVASRLREARPERDYFAWLDPRRGHTDVFITILVGGGIVVSGLAWVIDTVAGSTASATVEDKLARRLSVFRFPSDGLVADDAELLARDTPYCADLDLRVLLGPTGSGT